MIREVEGELCPEGYRAGKAQALCDSESRLRYENEQLRKETGRLCECLRRETESRLKHQEMVNEVFRSIRRGFNIPDSVSINDYARWLQAEFAKQRESDRGKSESEKVCTVLSIETTKESNP